MNQSPAPQALSEPAQSSGQSMQSVPLAPTMSCRTQLDAVAWLETQGYKVKKSTFNNHFKDNKISRNAHGQFEFTALLGYAAVHLEPLAIEADKKRGEAASEKIYVDNDLKMVRTLRERLKLEREQGALMPRSEYEDALAARAQFFKSEISSFIFRKSAEIIHLVGGNETERQRLISWWESATADWMDAWSRDREFVDTDTDAEAEANPAPATASTGDATEVLS